jgi:hypothetical protein
MSASVAALDAESAIGRRLEELRAIALGPMAVDEPISQPTTEPTMSLRADVSAPGRSVPMPSTIDFDHAPPVQQMATVQGFAGRSWFEAMQGSVERLEHAIGEDVARIEVLLRAWGDPQDAANRFGDRVLTELHKVEHAMRAEIATVAEQARRSGGNGGIDPRFLEALAAWTVQVEQASRQQSAMLADQIAAIATEFAPGSDSRQTALDEAIDQAAETVGTRMDEAIAELDSSIGEELAQIRALVDGIATSLAVGKTEPLAGSQAGIDATRSAISSSEEAVVRSIDRSGERVLTALARLQTTLSGLDANELGVAKIADTVDAVHRRIEKASHRQGTETQRLGDDLAERIEKLRTQVIEQDDATRQWFDALQTRIDDSREVITDSVSSVVEATTAALSNVSTQQQRTGQLLQQGIQHETARIRHELAAKFDAMRLSGARDAEQLIDALSHGWRTLFDRLDRVDTRLERIELGIGTIANAGNGIPGSGQVWSYRQ